MGVSRRGIADPNAKEKSYKITCKCRLGIVSTKNSIQITSSRINESFMRTFHRRRKRKLGGLEAMA